MNNEQQPIIGTEPEIKVLDVPESEIIALQERLERLAFSGPFQQSFRRYVYDIGSDTAWVRLRTDGEKAAITYKNSVSDEVEGMQELEIEISPKDFEKTNQFLELIGMKVDKYQENERIAYRKDGAEVVIDRWPLIPKYIEIEAQDGESVLRLLSELELDGYQTTSLSTKHVYGRYNLNLDDYPRLTFDTEK
jgi:adenylate cyclase class 2